MLLQLAYLPLPALRDAAGVFNHTDTKKSVVEIPKYCDTMKFFGGGISGPLSDLIMAIFLAALSNSSAH